MDAFQYLPDLAFEVGVTFSAPLGVTKSDLGKEQRISNSTVSEVVQPGRTFHQLDTVRKYSATYTSMVENRDSVIRYRLEELRGDTILLPFFIEPLLATADLAGLTSFQLSNEETPYSELKFVSGLMIRLDKSDWNFFEYRTVTTSVSDILNTGALDVTAPWTASIDPGNCVLFFLDQVYLEGPLPAENASSRVHHMPLVFSSI